VHPIVVRLVPSDDLHGLLGEVARVDLEVLVLVVFQDGESGVACPRTDLEESGRRRGGRCDAGQDGEFLLQPLAVLEEVRRVVLVEVIPPLSRVGIEPGFALSVRWLAYDGAVKEAEMWQQIQIGAKDVLMVVSFRGL
jgi:hypothetical protein